MNQAAPPSPSPPPPTKNSKEYPHPWGRRYSVEWAFLFYWYFINFIYNSRILNITNVTRKNVKKKAKMKRKAMSGFSGDRELVQLIVQLFYERYSEMLFTSDKNSLKSSQPFYEIWIWTFLYSSKWISSGDYGLYNVLFVCIPVNFFLKISLQGLFGWVGADLQY